MYGTDKKFNSEVYSYKYADDIAPRMQLDPRVGEAISKCVQSLRYCSNNRNILLIFIYKLKSIG